LFEFAVGLFILYFSATGRLVPFGLWFPDGLLFLLGGACTADGKDRAAEVVAGIAIVLFVVSVALYWGWF